MGLVDRPWIETTRGQAVLVPVGSVEQHGPHLPLDTDTVIATAVADRLAPIIGANVAPPVAYGASGEHQSFAGTISIGHAALRLVLIELVRSLRTWADHVVLVNGHGGNAATVSSAVRQLVDEGHLVSWVACAWAGDAHPGRSETSLMLHIDPTRVRLRAARAGNRAPVSELMPAMIEGGVAAVSANGVLGDPVGANPEEGGRLLDAMVSGMIDPLRFGTIDWSVPSRSDLARPPRSR